MSRKAAKSSAKALREALKNEKQRHDLAETAKFSRARQHEQELEASQRYPRSLVNGTFFTPHLGHRVTEEKPHKDIITQRLSIVPQNGRAIVMTSYYDGVRDPQTVLPKNMSRAVANEVFKLERAGFRYRGSNKDILYFDRQYNRKAGGRKHVAVMAKVFISSLIIVTTALFMSEHA